MVGPGNSGEGAVSKISMSVAQILNNADKVTGAGFLVTDTLLITCAHVLIAAGSGPAGRIKALFPQVPGASPASGQVVADSWHSPDGLDVALVQLDAAVAGATPVVLGSAAGCARHKVHSFGFPGNAPSGGRFGYGTAGDLFTDPVTGTLLQLTNANDLTTGFSGGPVVDEDTRRVIGMVTSIEPADPYLRGVGIVYATPTQVLQQLHADLCATQSSPYLYLDAFTAEDAYRFHGRDAAVNPLLNSLAEHRGILLLGPSGSGKTSLVQAGVLPKLARGAITGSERWLPLLTRPGRDLSAALDRVLPETTTAGIAAAAKRLLADRPEFDRVLLVIDQFEELLSDPHIAEGGPEAAVHSAVGQLALAAAGSGPVAVMLVLRDDFYPRLAALAPELLGAVPRVVNVPATLDGTELHDIIVRPARAVGVRFEAGLPERIIDDVLSGARGAPVTLLAPLELALSKLWEKCLNEGYLTHQAYHGIGGVTGSLAIWCNETIEQLSAGQHLIAQRILTALVRTVGDDDQMLAVRQPALVSTLRELAADLPDAASSAGTSDVDAVLAALQDHRIITSGTINSSAELQPTVELIHEALIRYWPDLRTWVAQNRRFHSWLHRADDQRTLWEKHHDDRDLLDGTALSEGLDWSRQRRLPTATEQFLSASHQRQRAAVRRSHRLNIALAALLILATTAAGIAYIQRQRAVSERRVSDAGRLAAQSTALLDTDPDLASLLAIQAYRTSASPDAAASLFAAASLPLRDRLVSGALGLTSAEFSPNGKMLATAGIDGTARLWDAATGKPGPVLQGHTGPVWSVVFSPDGSAVATASDDGTARLWDAATGKPGLILRGHTDRLTLVAFGPKGHSLATASWDGTARLWDAATGKPGPILQGHTGPVVSVVFSPDGRALATASADGTARLWDAATGKPGPILQGHTGPVVSVVFSP
ncbi:energy-coupling factor transporter ATP-binding protein EcfA2, partial [Catenulispora sp. GAS73]|uniref:nSTAND1 domain-containing NTPase n=1 Tax=Catenulispora sp. GAS73 TaxID=3156269 RepID=UPI0035112304